MARAVSLLCVCLPVACRRILVHARNAGRDGSIGGHQFSPAKATCTNPISSPTPATTLLLLWMPMPFGVSSRSQQSAREQHMAATLDHGVVDPQHTIAELQRKLDEALAERDEALQREIASAEVLQIINGSPGNLQPVFDAMLEKAMRLCDA